MNSEGMTEQETGTREPPPPTNNDNPEHSVAMRQQLERTQILRGALWKKAIKGDARSIALVLKCDQHESEILETFKIYRKRKPNFQWIEEEPPDGLGEEIPLSSPGECAELLGVSVKTIARAVENGELPAVTTPGGHRRIRIDDLEKYRAKIAKKNGKKSDKSDKSDNKTA